MDNVGEDYVASGRSLGEIFIYDKKAKGENLRDLGIFFGEKHRELIGRNYKEAEEFVEKNPIDRSDVTARIYNLARVRIAEVLLNGKV